MKTIGKIFALLAFLGVGTYLIYINSKGASFSSRSKTNPTESKTTTKSTVSDPTEKTLDTVIVSTKENSIKTEPKGKENSTKIDPDIARMISSKTFVQPVSTIENNAPKYRPLYAPK